MNEKQPPYPKFPEQDENGVDLSLIRANLRLSASERLRLQDAHLRDIERMRAQMPERTRRIYERLRKEW